MRGHFLLSRLGRGVQRDLRGQEGRMDALILFHSRLLLGVDDGETLEGLGAGHAAGMPAVVVLMGHFGRVVHANALGSVPSPARPPRACQRCARLQVLTESNHRPPQE